MSLESLGSRMRAGVTVDSDARSVSSLPTFRDLYRPIAWPVYFRKSVIHTSILLAFS
jgi:hypothetical protein